MSFMLLLSKISLPSNPVNLVNPVKIVSCLPLKNSVIPLIPSKILLQNH